jgi:hypothetical protein
MHSSNTLEELALEVVIAARNRTTFREFKKQCELSPPIPGKSYYERERVWESLIADGLIEIDDGVLRLTRNILNTPPVWLLHGLETGSELSWKIVESCGPTDQVLKKIDLLLLQKIGLEGELAVIEKLKNHLPAPAKNRIRHISLVDDYAGFDIQTPSVKNSDNISLLEIKTFSRPGNVFCFYISRNEARVASNNENWRLVGVIRTPIGHNILGILNFNQFSHLLPVDVSSNCIWESAKINLPISLFIPDLP